MLIAAVIHTVFHTILVQNDLIAVTVLAVFLKGLHIVQFLKTALGGAVVHTAQPPTLVFVIEHGVVAGFFCEDHIPVFPASTQLAKLGDQMIQRMVFRLKQILPEIIDSLTAAGLIDVLKKLTIRRNKLSTGNHT